MKLIRIVELLFRRQKRVERKTERGGKGRKREKERKEERECTLQSRVKVRERGMRKLFERGGLGWLWSCAFRESG